MRKVDREARLSFFHPPDLSPPSPYSATPAKKKCTNHKKTERILFRLSDFHYLWQRFY